MKKQSKIFNIEEQLHTAVCVPAIREEYKNWKKNGYKGITETTKELLNFWFNHDHILHDGRKFSYHYFQREAIETLIYISEVQKINSRKELLEKYAYQTKDLRLPPVDEFARFCFKMATGSGKTKMMSLAIVWQYFNAIKEDAQKYAKNFLIIAPNVIVFERLKTDFENGKIFKTDPLIPKHFMYFWEMNFYMRGDSERASSEGSLYLTNIQQFYERENNASSKETEQMTAVLGSPPPTQKLEITDFDIRIAKRDGLLMVINDEAHHTHEEDNEWNKSILKLNKLKPLTAQLDFSATPRYSAGNIFAWTIFDYPLKQAIIDGIVKNPIKGITHVQESKSSDTIIKYQAYLTAAIERWREYKKQLEIHKKNPVLFIMMSNTDEADEVAHWMQKKYTEEFSGDKTLIIHTDKKGEITKADLEDAREAARNIDEDNSPINAIVSVTMLKEGWDVQNVTVVLGLRPYTAKANILPEQTIGRGLRLMFRNFQGTFKERVDIIGTNKFMEFVDDLEKLEDLKFETFEIGHDKLHIVSIFPVPEKISADIGIPDITSIIDRKKSISEEINNIDVNNFKINTLPINGKGTKEQEKFIYEGRDILTDAKLFEREYKIPPVQTSEEIFGYYARFIAREIKLPSHFALLVPKIKEFFEIKAFGKKVDLNDKNIIKAINTNVAQYVVVKEFEKILKSIIIEYKEPELLTESKMLSETPPFPFSRIIYDSKKTIFNHVACYNKFEERFAKFLNKADDVISFAKIPENFGFSIQYTDTLTNIRNYYPDFVVKLKKKFYMVETKGMEDETVKHKDNAAKNWCEIVSGLVKTKWEYLKVPEKEFDKLKADSFEDLLTVLF